MAKPLDEALPDWSRGACHGVTDTNIFYPDEKIVDVPLDAASYCISCEIQPECLDWALRKGEKFGVWGNTTPQQRKKLVRIVVRVHCPGCAGTDVLSMNDAEICLSCGLSWRI